MSEEEEFDFKLSDLTEQLREIIHKEGSLYTNDLWNESKKLLPLKINSLQNTKPIHPDDSEGKHIFIQRFYKKKSIEPEKSYREVNQEEFEKDPHQESYYYAALIFNALIFFYNDGTTYAFNDYDGSIDQNFCFVEHEESYDLYGFYEYIGK